jgi:putative ABC transport system permease protein
VNFFIEIKEGLSFAYDAVRANKMRAVLTTLGIVIGIVTVTLMGATINGLNQSFHSSISNMGADVLYLNRVDWLINSWNDWLKQQKRPVITRDQVRAVERSSVAQSVAPVVELNQSISYNNRNSTAVSVEGTTDQFIAVRGFGLAQGRFFTSLESDAGRAVCVLGTNVAGQLFQRESPIGKTVRVGGTSLEVIGVAEKQGSFLDLPSLDDDVIVPLPQLHLHNADLGVQIKVAGTASVDDATEELRALMRRLRHLAPGAPDDFSINQQEQFITIFNQIGGTMATVGLVITGLSLFVGGIGIMNIMFVSVAERTREIGVRKAIGAKRRAILLQFLIEAAMICLLGGLVGLGIAYGLTFAVARVMPVSMNLPVVFLALLVSLLTGVISGFLPAWRAARMNAVDALRNE